jgi:hypothetical protein
MGNNELMNGWVYKKVCGYLGDVNCSSVKRLAVMMVTRFDSVFIHKLLITNSYALLISKTNNMNLKQKYRSPDNKQLKKIADYLIYVLLPFIQTSLALAETQGLITIKQAFWGGLAATFLLINTKFLTKFTTETPTTAPTLDGDGC